MATWLFTGATGFVGRHVLDNVLASPRAVGCDRAVALGRKQTEALAGSAFVRADLDDVLGLRSAIRQVQPDVVLHTAGRTPPAPNEELYRANFWGTIHLLAALKSLDKPVRVVMLGSAAELGPVSVEKLPVDESYPCMPVEAYGRGKYLATLAGLAEQSSLEVSVARVFNPIGPHAPPSQALGRFARLLAQPSRDPIDLITGDLAARRDFIDVRDAAAAMVAIARHGSPGLVYHVGTGLSRTVGQGLQHLIRLAGRSVRVHEELERGRSSPADSLADIRRLTEHTRWHPRISFEQSLADLWESVQPGTDRRALPATHAA